MVIRMKTFAIFGTGNVAQTLAADMKLAGHTVRLCAPEIHADRIENLFKKPQLEIVGKIQGKVTLDLVTTDVNEATKDADYICICVPGHRQEEYARFLNGHLTSNQIVFTFASCLSSLVYKKIWGDENCPVMAETNVPPYSTRIVAPGKVHVYAFHLGGIAFFPASASEKCYEDVKKNFYPFPKLYKDDLECALSLCNPCTHPGACLTNLSNIERPQSKFFLYEHGFTPSGLKIDVALNQERHQLANALGYKVHALEDFCGVEGDLTWEGIYAMGHGSYGMTSIEGPNSIYDRYMTEDVPFILLCWASLSAQLGLKTPVIDALVTLFSIVHEIDWLKKGKTVDKLGLEGKTAEQIINYVRTGKL